MGTTRLILVGGFLGAGKTTLLVRAAQRFSRQGKRVGLVANDQAADLVDTELLRETDAEVEEVVGGCFCCRFPDMVAAMERLVRDTNAEVLIGEPVGSCTDLSATVLQSLKKLHSDQFDLAPFSVLVDGNQVRVLDRLRQAARQDRSARFPDDVLYIYEKQLEEADLIVLNKCDLLSAAELAELTASLASRFPNTRLLTMSALSGDGVDAWLELLEQDWPAGGKIAEVDYDTYAAGEAALGWLNASIRLHADADTDWPSLAGELLEAIRADLSALSAEIAHLKVHLGGSGGHIVGNLTSNDGAISLHGNIAAACRDVDLLVNARVHVDPDRLRSVVEARLQSVAGRHGVELAIGNLRSFLPGRPQPTHRYDSII
jgi:Ni2+-binding GTPase involved in maturation of urease and hydrogenase